MSPYYSTTKIENFFQLCIKNLAFFPSKISLYAKKIQIIYNVAFFIALIWF